MKTIPFACLSLVLLSCVPRPNTVVAEPTLSETLVALEKSAQAALTAAQKSEQEDLQATAPQALAAFERVKQLHSLYAPPAKPLPSINPPPSWQKIMEATQVQPR